MGSVRGASEEDESRRLRRVDGEICARTGMRSAGRRGLERASKRTERI